MYIFHMYEEKTIVLNPSIYLHISNIYIYIYIYIYIHIRTDVKYT